MMGCHPEEVIGSDDDNDTVLPVAINLEMATELLNNSKAGKLPGSQQSASWANVVAHLEAKGFRVKRNEHGKEVGKRANEWVAGRSTKWIVFPDSTEGDRLAGYRLYGGGAAPEDTSNEDLI